MGATDELIERITKADVPVMAYVKLLYGAAFCAFLCE
jgi:hypothetical protein